MIRFIPIDSFRNLLTPTILIIIITEMLARGFCYFSLFHLFFCLIFVSAEAQSEESANREPNPELHFAHEIHEAIDEVAVDGEGLKAFAAKWSEKFNAVNWGFRFYRSFSLEETRRFRVSTYDVLFLMAFSHPLEMASGPVLVTLGVSHEWPAWLIASLGAGGAIISMPGLDPLCLILVGSYFGIAPWRKVVRMLREGSFQFVKWTGNQTGISSLSRQLSSLLIHSEFRLDSFNRNSRQHWPNEWFQSESLPDELRFEYFSPHQNFQLALRFHHTSEGSWLKEIELPIDNYFSFSDHKKYISGLGWNLRHALKEVLHQSKKEKPLWPFYVSSAQNENGRLRIQLRDGAIRMGADHSVKNPLAVLLAACSRKSKV